MPNYAFQCKHNHRTELSMSFAAHDALPRDEENRPYIDCPIKYGEEGNPTCTLKSVQLYETAGHIKIHL